LSGTDIRAEYERRLEARRQTAGRWGRLERRIADLRMVVGLAGILLGAWIAWGRGPGPAWTWLGIPVTGFVALVFAHEPVRRVARRAARACEFYERSIARLEGDWAGRGVPGAEFLDPEHPYAADLDLFGVGSLFERLCASRTRSGEEILANWLLQPASVDEVHERQEAVRELRPRIDLREDLELLGRDVRAGLDPRALTEWGRQPRSFTSSLPRLLAAILASLGAIALIGWAFLGWGYLPLLPLLAIDGVFAIALSRRVQTVLAAVDSRTHDLALLGGLIHRLECEPASSARLARLKEALETEGRPASWEIRRLTRMLHLLDTKRNQLFYPLAMVLLWTTQIAMAIDAWRARCGPLIARWLQAVGEFEALGSLAAYSAENPDDPFPEFEEGPPRFQGEALGHPLIPANRCIRNSVALGEPGPRRLLIVSGSNMSGKSTLLRTIGINAVLAQAGGPVRARRLALSPLAIGATLRVQDSLQGGKSRFFAEISRIRQLVDLARGSRPLLFLLDEIFHGTNSADRLVGARSIIRGLLDEGAIGLVTTHDLALTEMATELGPAAANVHFEDRFENGRILFDYRMRDGVVRHSNALELMRSVGLVVREPDPQPAAPLSVSTTAASTASNSGHDA
jgi:hypothetical protein